MVSRYSDTVKSFLGHRLNLMAVLLLVVVCILPFIIRLHLLDRDIHSLDYKAFPEKSGDYDFYHYYKAIVLVAVSFLLLAVGRLNHALSKSKLSVLLFLMAFFVLFSSLLSEYKSFTLLGGATSFQGVFVWLSYIVLAFGAMQMNSQKHFKWMAHGLIISAAFMAFLGLFQFFGFDARILIQDIIYHSGHTMKIGEGLESYIYSLSFNPNYYGIYMAMALVVNLALFIQTPQRKKQILLGITHVLLYANLVGSQSRAANLTLYLCLIFLLLVLRKKNKGYLKKYLILFVLSIGLYVTITHGYFPASKLNHLEIQRTNSSLKEIVVEDSIMEIRPHTLPPLFIKVRKDGKLNFGEESSFQKVLVFKKGDTLSFENPRFGHYKFYFKDSNRKQIVTLRYDNTFDYNILVTDSTFKTFDHLGRISPIINPPKWEYFNRRNTFATYRGMLWALSAPILKNTVILGYGADSFPLVYPNKDYVSRLKSWGNLNQSHANTAHSLYFQIGIEFGLIALVVFVLLIVWFLCNTVRFLWNLDFSQWTHYFLLGCSLAVFMYAFTGITNSSMLSSSPNFWVLLGIGIACLNHLKRNVTNL